MYRPIINGGVFMCTSFTLHAKDESYMLSRTMDFSIEMAKTVTYIPQNFHRKLRFCKRS